MIYYFIVYEEMTRSRSQPLVAEVITNKFPVDWLIDIKKQYTAVDIHIRFWIQMQLDDTALARYRNAGLVFQNFPSDT